MICVFLGCRSEATAGRCCAEHRALADRIKDELSKPRAGSKKSAPVRTSSVEPTPRRRKAPPNFAESIASYVAEQNHPVSRSELAEHFAVSETTAGRYATKARTAGQIFQSHAGFISFDGPLKLAEAVRLKGSAKGGDLREALGISAELCRAWARRAQDRGLIRVEPGSRLGYMPVSHAKAA